jgi:glycine C-acetyltransferase
MLKGTFNYTPPAALTGSARDYRRPRGAQLAARIEGFFKWQNLRRQHGLWPYSRSMDQAPLAVTAARDDAGGHFRGVNFATADYLGLASHPKVKAAACEAVERFGVHSGSSAAHFGGSAASVQLERRIADFLQMPEALLFPSGWAAVYGAIKGVVRTEDHVLLDAQAQPAAMEAAAAATKNHYLFRHNTAESCRAWLQKIRARDTVNGILVVTESQFTTDAESGDLATLQSLCHEYEATLLVDVSNDLGARGDHGQGVLGEQSLLGAVDLVAGSFARTFASNGGFVACRNRELKEYLRFFASSCAASSALSPVQVAVVGEALSIVESAEGTARRKRLLHNAQGLRHRLTEASLELSGEPSGLVCVKAGAESLARLVARRLPEAGLLANLAEFPAAPKDQARFWLHVSADHTDDNILDAANALASAFADAHEELDWLGNEREKLRAHG